MCYNMQGANNKYLTCSGPGNITTFTSFVVVQFSAVPSVTWPGIPIMFTDGTWVTGNLGLIVKDTFLTYTLNPATDTVTTTVPSTQTTYVITIVDSNASTQIYFNGTQISTST